MTVKLALYKGKGKLFNRLVRWWTGSQYSHCELVVEGLWYSSSLMDGGVRRKHIDPRPGHWDFIELPFVSADQVRAYFYETDDDKYGVIGLITAQVFNRNRAQDHAQFCSQWCAAAMGIPNPASYSPRTLGEISRFLAL